MKGTRKKNEERGKEEEEKEEAASRTSHIPWGFLFPEFSLLPFSSLKSDEGKIGWFWVPRQPPFTTTRGRERNPHSRDIWMRKYPKRKKRVIYKAILSIVLSLPRNILRFIAIIPKVKKEIQSEAREEHTKNTLNCNTQQFPNGRAQITQTAEKTCLQQNVTL